MTDTAIDCATCPKLLERNLLTRQGSAERFCFDCPNGYRRAAFVALVSRLNARSPRIRSCTLTR